MKATKKIVGASCALVAALALSAGSTFAWLTANQNVSVTGMAVKVSTPSNLLVADASEAVTDSSFGNALVLTSDNSAILEPVSSIDGLDFYYTKTSNVSGTNGSAINMDFVKLEGKTTEAFQTTYSNTDAVGYIDYTIALKAYNSGESAQYIVMDGLTLTYSGTDSNSTTAFRVAVLTGAGTESNGSITFDDVASNAVYSTGDTYLTKGQAVSLVTTKNNEEDDDAEATTTYYAAVKNLNTAANIYKVDATETGYVKVVLRLWVEGEDESCTNATFAKLTSSWTLDASFTLTSSETAEGRVSKLTYTNAGTLYYVTSVAGLASDEEDLLETYKIDKYTYTAYAANTVNNKGELDESEVTIYKCGSRWYLIDTKNGYNISDITDRVSYKYEVSSTDTSTESVPVATETYYKYSATANGTTYTIYGDAAKASDVTKWVTLTSSTGENQEKTYSIENVITDFVAVIPASSTSEG